MKQTLIDQRQEKVAQRQVFISCIVPIYNEAEVISDFLLALDQYLSTLTQHYEIIVVDDGSKDQSSELVTQFHQSNPSTKLITFSRNFGKEVALSAGLKEVQGDVAVIIDADFQHPTHYIEQFLTHWAQGYDMVYGVQKNRKNESFIKRYFSKLFYRLLDLISDVTIPPNAGDFRLMDKKVVSSLNRCTERARFMKGLYAWVGYQSKAVPFEANKRAGGKPSYRYGKLTNLAINGFISFSDVPLRIWFFIGVIICGVSFVTILYIVLDTLFFGSRVPGYATLLTTVIFFGGIQILSIGILGEYLSRVFNEVKNRPPYVIESSLGFDDHD